MKRKRLNSFYYISIFVILVISTAMFTGCDPEPYNRVNLYVVTFDTKLGNEITEPVEPMTVEEGQSIGFVEAELKEGMEASWKFKRWVDEAGNEYSSSTPVNCDLTLYAQWISIWDGKSTDRGPFSSVSPDDNIIHINTAAELAGLAAYVNDGNNLKGVTVLLENDIDLSDGDWNPIGVYAVKQTERKPFTGNFDGNGHSITGLNVDKDNYSGLFGYIENSNISGLSLSGSVKSTSQYAGGLLGVAVYDEYDQTGYYISDIYSNVNVDSGSAGGIAGEIRIPKENILTVENIHSKGFIAGQSISAGVIASMLLDYRSSVKFENIENTADVIGGSESGIISGIIGEITIKTSEAAISLSNVVNLGTVSNADNIINSHASGLIGYAFYNGGYETESCIEINNSFNHGFISGAINAGGLIGESGISLDIENSGNTNNITATQIAGGIVGFAGTNRIMINSSTNSGDVVSACVAGGILGQTNYWTGHILTFMDTLIECEVIKGDIAGSIVGEVFTDQEEPIDFTGCKISSQLDNLPTVGSYVN